MEKYSGKNLNEALAAAAAAKGCRVDELTYTTTEEKQGLFGFGSRVEIEAYCDNDIRDFIVDYLKKYFDGIHMNVEIDCYKEDYYFKICLDADNNAILIGKNGQTLTDINTTMTGRS